MFVGDPGRRPCPGMIFMTPMKHFCGSQRVRVVSIPLVLQPVTPTGGVDAMPEPDRLVRWLDRAEERLADVRLIPQTHPIYGVL